MRARVLPSIFVLLFLLNACNEAVDTVPLDTSGNQIQSPHDLNTFKTIVRDNFLFSASGENGESAILEEYGMVFWEAFVAFETSRESQIGFIPLFRSDSKHTEAVLIASVVGNTPYYTFLVRGSLYLYRDLYATNNQFPSVSILASIFTSFDNALFGESTYDYSDIIGEAPIAGDESAGAINVGDSSNFNDVKSEWVGYEICEFTFTGTHDEPYQYLTDIHCYTDWIWESLPREPEILDYNPGGGGVGGTYVSRKTRDERVIDNESDPRKKFNLQMAYLISHGGEEGKALAAMLKDLIETSGITVGDAYEIFRLADLLYKNLKGQYLLAIFSVDNVSTILSFGLSNGLSNVARTGFTRAISRYGSAYTRSGGMTVLGKYPEYLNLAESLGAKRFSIPSNIWNGMTPAQQWSANVQFLERAIARGDKIVLSNRVTNLNAVTGWFRRELDYLISKGYKLSRNGTYLYK